MKTKGTIMAEETRKKTNGITRAERDKLQKAAMKIIHGKK